MIPGDAWRTYEDWRRLWLAGKDGHGVQALRFHGLCRALELAGCTGVRQEPQVPTPASVVADELFVGDAALAEAAWQVRHLLREAPVSSTGSSRVVAHV